ncbi:MAG: oligoendopeptidase F [Clostridiales bacterium]|nr:oligoendopeptidase F [Clostridiales bacterium]
MNKLPKRSEIEDKYKWNLEDIYRDDEAYEVDFSKTEKLYKEMQAMQKEISDAESLKKCLELYEDMYCLVDNLFSYSRMRMDEDNSDSKYQVLLGRARELATKADASAAFIEPLILQLPEDVVNSNTLEKYRIYLNEVLRKKKHTLSAPEEKILAKSAEATGASQEIFSMFNNADIKFPEIKDEKGNMTEVTKGRYITFMESKNSSVRKDAFDALYDTYGKYKNTLAASYSSNIKAAKFYSEARGYNSSLEASLDSDNISTDVYDNLVTTINNNLPLLHKYVKIRAKALEMEKINMWDIYVPLVEQDDDKYSFEQACDMVSNGLGILGDEYVSLLKKGFESGWVDIYENEGKTSGAYSWGTYLSHPFVLLNYQGTLDNVFTLAHEMGHSLHTYYSSKNQPYIYSHYKIFVAEVASTVNEILLLKYMLAETTDKKKRAFLINHFLETFRGTIFRQTMFAEFEKICHGSYGEGKPLSGDDLCSIYLDLNKKYYGEACEIDEKIKHEWSRIPHFYRSFYVYKYATGLSAAAAIAKMIEDEGAPAIERYIDFLKAGDSEYPLEILKKTGVDLSTPAPIEAGMKMFSDLLDEFESLV